MFYRNVDMEDTAYNRFIKSRDQTKDVPVIDDRPFNIQAAKSQEDEHRIGTTTIHISHRLNQVEQKLDNLTENVQIMMSEMGNIMSMIKARSTKH